MSDTTINPTSIRPQTVVINDKKELYKCYMSFIKGGGLFIPFNEDVSPTKIFPGQKVFVVFSMLENKQKTPINGKVIWINRSGSNRGYGIALGDNLPMKALKDNIETHIADLMAKKEPNYTL
jgi:type IV pilus assembly protein PilZ